MEIPQIPKPPETILQNVQVPVKYNQEFLTQRLQEARETLDRIESCLSAPLGYDDQGNAIVWDSIDELLSNWDLDFSLLDGTFMQNETGQSSTLHEKAPQTLTGHPALIIEIEMSHGRDVNAYANAHADIDADIDDDEEEEEEEEEAQGHGGIILMH